MKAYCVSSRGAISFISEKWILYYYVPIFHNQFHCAVSKSITYEHPIDYDLVT